jgi:hypothetical protein
MLKLLTCPRGHFYERPDEDAHAPCPECGAPPDTLPLLDLVPEGPPAAAPPADDSGPPQAAADDLFDPRGRPVVAGYEILEDLGRGPTGVRRFSARQTVVRRKVLLEVVVAREDAGQEAWAGLRGAAAALAKLSHPNIVQLYDAGERDRQLFFNVLELVEGPTLAQKVADKPLPFRQVARLMELLALAVAAAHEQGVLHRNLKPSSVLLQPVGLPEEGPATGEPQPAACALHSASYAPRLTDFGLARRPLDGDPTDVPLYGDEVGFLSPEQAWGRTKDLSPATDVYGLGAVLYFLLTGRPPFGGPPSPEGPSVPDVLDAVQSTDLKPPRAVRRVPADLDAICRKCLARAPRRRYPTAGALADDLRRAARGLPLACRQPTAAGRFGKWVRRQPAVAALLLVAVLGLVSSIAAFCVGLAVGEDAPHGPPPHQLQAAQLEAAQLRRKLAVFEEKEQFALYRRRLAAAYQALRRNQPGAARTFLGQCPARFRGIEYYSLLVQAAGNQPTRLAGHEGVTALAFHPFDGRWLAVASTVPGDLPGTSKGVVRVHDVLARREVVRLADFPGPVHALCYSRSGFDLATAGGDAQDANAQVCLWNIAGPGGGHRRWAAEFPRQRTTGLACSTNGLTLVAAASTGALFLLDARDGDVIGDFGVIAQGRAATSRVCYTPTGDRVASFTVGARTVHLWNPEVRLRERWFTFPADIQDVALGQRWLAVAGSDNTVRLADRSTGVEKIKLPVLGLVRRVALSADGARLAAATEVGEAGVVYVWALQGDEAFEVLRLNGPGGRGLSFDVSGKRLAGAGPAEVVVWGAQDN